MFKVISGISVPVTVLKKRKNYRYVLWSRVGTEIGAGPK